MAYFRDSDNEYTFTVGRALDEPTMLGGFTALMNDQDYRPGIRELVDLRSVEDVMINARSIHNLVKLRADFHEAIRGNRMAIVVQAPSLFGFARMFQTLSSDLPIEVEVFWSVEKATSWLNNHTLKS